MKNTTIIKTTAIFGLAIFMFNVSQAQSKNKQKKKALLQVSDLIQKMDADENGMLSEGEVKGRLKGRFSEIDENKDGALTRQEIELFQSETKNNRKNRTNKKEPFSELLEKRDANEDGKLSEEEVRGRLKANFDKIDLDGDGFISEDEQIKANPNKGL